MIIVTSDIFTKIRKEMDELQNRKPLLLLCEFSGGDLRWRGKT
jgi:vacuolar-type H+-ATPase subunit F/Vma7